MTPADIVAEALAHANAITPKDLHGHVRSTCKITDVEATATIEIVLYRRQDVVDAALAHLATRAAEAEGRAERAEVERDRLQKLFDDAGEDAYNVLALIDHYQARVFEEEDKTKAAGERAGKLRAAIVRVLDQRNKLSAVPYSIAIEALDEDDAALRKEKEVGRG